MQKWKQAWQIAKFELSVSTRKIAFGCLIILGFFSYAISSFQQYLDNNVIGYDLFFILFFTLGINIGNPNYWHLKQADVYPLLMTQLPLPIQQEIVIKSRFIIHFCFSFPVQIAFLIIFYVASPIADLLSIPAYIAFAIIWLSVNLYIGTLTPISEVYPANWLFTVAMTFFFLFIFLFILTLSNLIFDHSVVKLSIIIAKNWPVISSMVSLIIGFAAVKAHQIYMKQIMNKRDYF
ncbi:MULTISPECIES: hypothetical protein [Clostridia]|uniref:hypothetical protein n=1 Tax=Clostridia TaxID=186801 RepID=UPI000EA3727E|nr:MULTISPECIES: hypothetical protein [Clostridia]NBJ70266.1 hypothetical protein [Roseburia sp. 1XD42-34]RKI76715.1 hypothetical protein D7V87_12655 [Clostridium sp. 1xD42-85]